MSYDMHLSFGITGVVFNEMKGVYSQPDNVLGRVSQQVCNSLAMDCSQVFMTYLTAVSGIFTS